MCKIELTELDKRILECLFHNAEKDWSQFDYVYSCKEGFDTKDILGAYAELKCKLGMGSETETLAFVYDPSHGDNNLCECGHTYVRHFDPYEDMAPVGCKYCMCEGYKKAEDSNE